MNYISSVTDWQFMNEPLTRWFLFIGAFIFITMAWGGILDFMRSVV